MVYSSMSENQRDPQYKLRWPEGLRDKIAASAKEHNRSMNSDIIHRLEQSFKSGGAPTEREKRILEQLELSQRTVKIFMHYLEALKDGDPMGDLDGIRVKYPDWFKDYDEFERQKLEQEKSTNSDDGGE